MKILLIEDDQDVTDTICSVLTSFFEDVHIEHIGHGDDFRRGIWRQGGWDLVVLDLMIPGMTGFDICEQIRSYSKTKGVPIFALTGYDTLQNEQRIKSAGATGYMAKPFEISHFLNEVKKLVKI